MQPDDVDDLPDASDAEAWRRLGRYLEGRSAPDEARRVEEWIAADTGRQDLVSRLRRALLSVEAAPDLWDTDDAWVRLRARLGAAERDITEPEPSRTSAPRPLAPARSAPSRRPPMVALTRRRRSRVDLALRAAAVIAMLVGGGALWQGRDALFGTSSVAMRDLATATGEQLRVTLDDGTLVVLAPGSRLRAPARFGDTRDVRLAGEAVFEVAPDPERPFRVHAAHAVTRVIGTRFGVHAYPGDGYANVVVEEGRVSVAATRDPSAGEGTAAGAAPTGRGAPPEHDAGVELTPGFAVRVRADGGIETPRAVDARRALAWTDGLLAFDDVPLSEVVRTLERRYDLRIRLVDPALGAHRLTAEFRRPTDAEVVRLIALSLGVEYRSDDDGFLLLSPTPTAEMPPNRRSVP